MPKSSGSVFLRATRHDALGASDQQRNLPAPPLMTMLGEVKEKIPLPAAAETKLLHPDFAELMERRRSRRRYLKQPLTLAQLSYLLWSTQGVLEVHGRMATMRCVPSAGARHAFETLVAVRRVKDLAAGLYQYDPFEHRLFLLDDEADRAAAITAASYDQSCVANGAVILVWVAIPYRMNWRYGERGYRYLHLDAGHVCQNLYLAAEALGLGTVAVAAFDDAALDAACGVDGEDRFAIYLAPVGKPARGG